MGKRRLGAVCRFFSVAPERALPALLADIRKYQADVTATLGKQVWTGPEAQGNVARDTGIVVRQLFERATDSVIIGGFRFDHGASLFAPLHERMQHGLQVTIFVDIEGHSDTQTQLAAQWRGLVARGLVERHM